jgi:hypothetical protein
MSRASSACRIGSASPARRTRLSSSFAVSTIRCKSALRCLTSGAVSTVTVDSSAGHNPPVTHGVQSTESLKAGIFTDSRAALRRRWRAVFRPKIATAQAYRHLRLPNSDVGPTPTAVRVAQECGELCDHLHLGTVSGWLIQDFSSSWMKCARCLAGRENCSAPTPSRRPPTSPPTETPSRPGSARPGARHCVGPSRPGNSCATNLSIAPSRSSAVGTSADGV